MQELQVSLRLTLQIPIVIWKIFLLQLSLLTVVIAAYRYIPEEEVSVPPVFSHKYVVLIQEIPYHVLVVYSNLYCSGSLVRSNIVVTAASCLSVGDMTNLVVKVGANTITDRGDAITIIFVKIHEYFQHLSLMDNDIAMLVLERHVTFSKEVKKVILVDPEVSLRPGIIIEVSGWGGNNVNNKFLYKLLISEMVVVNKSECQDHYRSLVTRSNFCAKYQTEHRLSDNGGPAVFRGLLVGIVSFGANRDTAPRVALLTNISYFNRWINKNCNEILSKNCIGPLRKEKNEQQFTTRDYYA